MVTIKWCLQQKNGIELIEPNENLCNAYFIDADDSLKAMDKNEGKWKVVTAYYACYNALYALLMKVGIKCEIHDCTLSLMSFLEFIPAERMFLQGLKQQRIDVQYYLRSAPYIDTLQIKKFVADCKSKAGSLHLDKIDKIRRSVKNG